MTFTEVRAPAVRKVASPARLWILLSARLGILRKSLACWGLCDKCTACILLLPAPPPPPPPKIPPWGEGEGRAGRARPAAPSPAARAALGRVPSSSILSYWQHSAHIDSPPPKLRKRINERSVISLREQTLHNRGRIFCAQVTSPNCTGALPVLCHFIIFAITPRRW